SAGTASRARLGRLDAQDDRHSPIGRTSSQAWPEMPSQLTALWDRFAQHDVPANSCLVNYYDKDARMSLHRDDTEGAAALSAPVVSISLGDEGLFRMGGLSRKDATSSHWVCSGDVVVIGGAARLAYHGIDRIRFGSSSLLSQGGRINVTLRVAEPVG
ncbi:MAG: alpha-ketoglutarate-dependent dioxygenase AlkB, partial [Pseudomonadota bacterium]